MKNTASINRDRRTFLRIAPAAATGITLMELMASAARAQMQGPESIPESGFQLFSERDVSAAIKELTAKPGPANSKRLVNDKNFLLDLWVEKQNAGKEYEWHEQRDHIVTIVEGETSYEVGGKPQGAHSTGPGEWLAPGVEGATKMTLKKGDVLVIRRGTLHKRTTAVGVTFTLAAPLSPVAG